MPGDSGRTFTDPTSGGYQHLTTTREGLVASLRNPAASRRPEANASREPPEQRAHPPTAADAAVVPAVLGGSFAVTARFLQRATSQARVLEQAQGAAASPARRRPADDLKALDLASSMSRARVTDNLQTKPAKLLAATAGASPRRVAPPAFFRATHVQYSGVLPCAEFTVPQSGLWRVGARGGAGGHHACSGNPGGTGASVSACFALPRGALLRCLVGGAGLPGGATRGAATAWKRPRGGGQPGARGTTGLGNRGAEVAKDAAAGVGASGGGGGGASVVSLVALAASHAALRQAASSAAASSALEPARAMRLLKGRPLVVAGGGGGAGGGSAGAGETGRGPGDSGGDGRKCYGPAGFSWAAPSAAPRGTCGRAAHPCPADAAYPSWAAAGSGGANTMRATAPRAAAAAGIRPTAAAAEVADAAGMLGRERPGLALAGPFGGAALGGVARQAGGAKPAGSGGSSTRHASGSAGVGGGGGGFDPGLARAHPFDGASLRSYLHFDNATLQDAKGLSGNGPATAAAVNGRGSNADGSEAEKDNCDSSDTDSGGSSGHDDDYDDYVEAARRADVETRCSGSTINSQLRQHNGGFGGGGGGGSMLGLASGGGGGGWSGGGGGAAGGGGGGGSSFVRSDGWAAASRGAASGASSSTSGANGTVWLEWVGPWEGQKEEEDGDDDDDNDEVLDEVAEKESCSSILRGNECPGDYSSLEGAVGVWQGSKQRSWQREWRATNEALLYGVLQNPIVLGESSCHPLKGVDAAEIAVTLRIESTRQDRGAGESTERLEEYDEVEDYDNNEKINDEGEHKKGSDSNEGIDGREKVIKSKPSQDTKAAISDAEVKKLNSVDENNAKHGNDSSYDDVNKKNDVQEDAHDSNAVEAVDALLCVLAPADAPTWRRRQTEEALLWRCDPFRLNATAVVAASTLGLRSAGPRRCSSGWAGGGWTLLHSAALADCPRAVARLLACAPSLVLLLPPPLVSAPTTGEAPSTPSPLAVAMGAGSGRSAAVLAAFAQAVALAAALTDGSAAKAIHRASAAASAAATTARDANAAAIKLVAARTAKGGQVRGKSRLIQADKSKDVAPIEVEAAAECRRVLRLITHVHALLTATYDDNDRVGHHANHRSEGMLPTSSPLSYDARVGDEFTLRAPPLTTSLPNGTKSDASVADKNIDGANASVFGAASAVPSVARQISRARERNINKNYKKKSKLGSSAASAAATGEPPAAFVAALVTTAAAQQQRDTHAQTADAHWRRTFAAATLHAWRKWARRQRLVRRALGHLGRGLESRMLLAWAATTAAARHRRVCLALAAAWVPWLRGALERGRLQCLADLAVTADDNDNARAAPAHGDAAVAAAAAEELSAHHSLPDPPLPSAPSSYLRGSNTLSGSVGHADRGIVQRARFRGAAFLRAGGGRQAFTTPPLYAAAPAAVAPAAAAFAAAPPPPPSSPEIVPDAAGAASLQGGETAPSRPTVVPEEDYAAALVFWDARALGRWLRESQAGSENDFSLAERACRCLLEGFPEPMVQLT